MTVYKCDVCGAEKPLKKNLQKIKVPAYKVDGKEMEPGMCDVEMCQDCFENYVRTSNSNVLNVKFKKKTDDSEFGLEVQKLWLNPIK